MLPTLHLLEATDFPALHRDKLDTLQVNLGYRCNQTCVHCHVNAGPTRTEMMNQDMVALIPQVLRARGISTLDLTGGAPELHEQFRQIVKAARELGVKVIDRCNLTILFEPNQEDLADFWQKIRLKWWLPYHVIRLKMLINNGVKEHSIKVSPPYKNSML